jgi:hypothetical protein
MGHYEVSGPVFFQQHVAQWRHLPEGSEVPYGQGVFVRDRYLPLWSASKLVFAGYCGGEPSLAWSGARELVVDCQVSEGTPRLLPPPAGLVVVHSSDGS